MPEKQRFLDAPQPAGNGSRTGTPRRSNPGLTRSLHYAMLLLAFAAWPGIAIAQDCNNNGIPDECDLDCGDPNGPCDLPGCGQSEDCNGNAIPDECDILDGTSPDCNENGIPDECEIAADPLLDCDGDGVLNECELDPGQRDCDLNGICDAIDIANCDPNDPACQDCNGNEIPDGCDIGPGGGGFLAELNLADLDGTDGFVINGISAVDHSGISVSSAGDVNNDGIDDLVIGASGADPNGADQAGESYVVFGEADVGSAGAMNLADLDGTNGFVITGIDAGDQSGISVSSAGDVNNDGIDDLVIGAPGANPNGVPGAGESYVVFGGPGVGSAGVLELSGLDGTDGFVINGIDAGDHSGSSVSSAGDVNNDGIDDLVIGAPHADANVHWWAGESYVIFGGPGVGGSGALNLSDLDGTNGFAIYGSDAAGESGCSVSSAGDVNNDGIDDVIIGADYADPNGVTSAGESYVVFGGADVGSDGALNLADLDGTNGFVVNGIDYEDHSGYSVSSAGDVNHDGIDDLVIGAYRADPNGVVYGGESYVIFGAIDVGNSGAVNLADLDGASGFVINGKDVSDESGSSVSSAGDVNNDGIDDLLIGAPAADPNGAIYAGESYVVFGGPGVGGSGVLNLADLDGTNGFVVNGIDYFDASGWSVSSAGDVNNDGIDDLIIGANYADPNGVDSAGESYVVFGRPFSADCNVNSVPDECDIASSTSPDCNGNGTPDECDVADGTSQDCNGNGVPDECDIADCQSELWCADCNENGIPDGCDVVPFGSRIDASDLDGTNGFVINGIDAGDGSGRSVSWDGDVNHDGIDDLVIGAPGADPNGVGGAGESYVVFGGTNLSSAGAMNLTDLDGTNGFVINGIDNDDFSGSSVSSAGDVNNDGIDDLIIGAWGGPNGVSRAGESYVVFGATDLGSAGAMNLADLDGTNGFVINGIDAGDRSGWRVSSAGDVNNDGIDDLVIGAPEADPNGLSSAGESYVVFGGPGVGGSGVLDLADLDGMNGFVVHGIDYEGRSGSSVSSAGDVNNDGIDDLIIGVPQDVGDPMMGAGKSYVVFGGTDLGSAGAMNLANLDGTNGFVINGIDYGDGSGRSVSWAGDINHDGIDDLVIGAPGADPNGVGGAGESYVVFGAADLGSAGAMNLADLDGSNGFVVNGINPGDESGYSVSLAGDINNDGIDDLIIGARYADPNGVSDAGESYVVFGGPSVGGSGALNLSDLDGTNGFVVNGRGAGDYSGYSVSSAGDINKDGIDDLMIGAYNADPDGTYNAGQSYVVFGRSTDCNGNGVPDDCDIADCDPNNPNCQDCNYNWIPDECDIATGISGDCNINGIPDECEMPQSGDVLSNWDAEDGLWSESANWCLPEVPDDNVEATFSVVIEDATSVVTLDISPSLASLEVLNGAVLEVDAFSGATARSIFVDNPISNDGLIQAIDGKRLVLDAADVLQAPTGVLRADGVGSRIEVNRRSVTNGSALGLNGGQIELKGSGELVNVHVQGDVVAENVVVPDGQTGALAGTITNDGVIAVGDPNATSASYLVPTELGTTLSGPGVVKMKSHLSRLGDFAGSFTNASDHRIEGAGVIFGDLINDGVVEADRPGLSLWISPPGDKISDGILRATDGGILDLWADVAGNGDIEARSGGLVLIDGAIVENHSLTIQGGTVTVAHSLISFSDGIDLPPDGTYRRGALELSASTFDGMDGLFVSDGVLTLSTGSDVTIGNGPVVLCPDAESDPAPVAELRIDDVDSALAAVDLEVCADGVLDVAGVVTLTGSLTFANTQESDWWWGPSAALEMLGGTDAADHDPSGYVQLEIGGEDLGDDPNNHVGNPAGFADNFDLSELVIGPGAHVSLVDLVDNANRDGVGGAAEALYVDTLTFVDSEGRLNLNGLHLYYDVLIGDILQIYDHSPLLGDLDGDGDVDLADLAQLLAHYGRAGPWTYEDGDLDLDGDVDQADLAALLAVYGTTST